MSWYNMKTKEKAKKDKPEKYPFKAVYVNDDISIPIESLKNEWVYAISIAQARAIFIKKHPWLANSVTFQPDFDPDKYQQDKKIQEIKDKLEKERKSGVDESVKDAWWNK